MKWCLLIPLALTCVAQEADTNSTLVSETPEDTDVFSVGCDEEAGCCDETAQECVSGWIDGGCLWEMEGDCKAYDNCATDALDAGQCGVDCVSEEALSCGDEWVQMGCTVPGQQIPMDFVSKCSKFTPCVRLYGRGFNDCLKECDEPGSRGCFQPCIEESLERTLSTADHQTKSFSSTFGVCLGMIAVFEELCSSTEANECIETWVENTDCWMDAFVELDACKQFELCAYGAQEEGRCPELDRPLPKMDHFQSPQVETLMQDATNGIKPDTADEEGAAQELEAEEDVAEVVEEEVAGTASIPMALLAVAATAAILAI